MEAKQIRGGIRANRASLLDQECLKIGPQSGKDGTLLEKVLPHDKMMQSTKRSTCRGDHLNHILLDPGGMATHQGTRQG